MDALLFLAIWLGGAAVHTAIELKMKNEDSSGTAENELSMGEQQPVTIKEEANSYE
ncbi:hypothetical protein [Desulfosediminicola flagellatus]|uniref:hypothetical protein n=1 Tax=Desulfosediminicola flagellatus TaxID=2569541 RepID=UPI0012948078|nr:hypothetical protein [Desulfosediminicola flagellatus]